MMESFNYLLLDDTLSCSGMPTAEQLSEAAKDGVKLIINLALTTSQGALPNEGELVESLGMKYIHIPVEWNDPTRQNLNDFFEAMDAHQGLKIHVHCQANYRASAFITLYRILKLGWEKEKSLAEMNKIWNPEGFPVWKAFLHENLK